LLIDLRQVDVDTFAAQLRQLLDGWAPVMSPARKLVESSFHEISPRDNTDLAVAVASKTIEQPATPIALAANDKKLYFDPFRPARVLSGHSTLSTRML
jgi:hypothetical protein